MNPINRIGVGYAPQVKSSRVNNTLDNTRQRSIDTLNALDVDLVEGPLFASDADTEELASEFQGLLKHISREHLTPDALV